MSNYNPFTLEGKTILVTGASSGIGKATAIECSKMGAKLVITGRNAERLQQTFELLEGEGHLQMTAEMSNRDEIMHFVDRLPILDGCVNNAGKGVMQLVPFFKEESLLSIFDVNVLGPIWLTHLIVKKKKIAKGGSIVFTSSIAGRGVSSPSNSLYSSTKGAVSAFVRNAALELGAKDVRCNSVAPGMVETPLMVTKNVTDEQWEANRQLYPLKRFGKPEDIAHAIIYLLSDASSWVTGAEIVIDGGRSLK